MRTKVSVVIDLEKIYRHSMKAAILAAALLSAPSHAQSIDANDIHNVTDTMIKSVYRPGFTQFSTDASALKKSTLQLCRTPSAALLNNARESFKATAKSFSVVEIYRIGPMIEENRYHKIFYWPDSRNAGERQLRKLLNDTKSEWINAGSVQQKSVAVQGLPALERLLFDKSSATQLSKSNASIVRCNLTVAVASNLARLAQEIDEAWQDQIHGFSERLLNPTSDDPLYRNHTEVLRSIMTQLTVGIEFLIARKLKPQMPAKANKKPSLKKAPLWKSENTLENFRGNVLALQSLALTSGLSALSSLENEIQFEFKTALTHLDKLMLIDPATTPDYRFKPEAMSIMGALLSGLEALQLTISDRLASELGVHAGFNSEDGD